MRLILILAASLLAVACAPSQYVATEYPVDNAEVPAFDVSGEVEVSNGYAEGEAESVPVWDSQIPADLHQVSQVFADLLATEIEQNGDSVGGSANKTIDVKVTNIYARNRMAYVEGNVSVELTLGNGDVVTIKKVDGSPAGMQRSLDGVINKAVIEALSNQSVQSYLAE